MELNLFGIQEQEHDWQKEWVGMPEYNNPKPQPPGVTALFKFRSRADFDMFMDVVKTNLYNGKRVFDGNQKKNEYNTWYPLEARPSEFVYIREGDDEK